MQITYVYFFYFVLPIKILLVYAVTHWTHKTTGKVCILCVIKLYMLTCLKKLHSNVVSKHGSEMCNTERQINVNNIRIFLNRVAGYWCMFVGNMTAIDWSFRNKLYSPRMAVRLTFPEECYPIKFNKLHSSLSPTGCSTLRSLCFQDT